MAGDQLFVDLELSLSNVPPGTRPQIGTMIVKVTARPHTGCERFSDRFGLAAHRWLNGVARKHQQLRGICAKVVRVGRVSTGDTIAKQPPR